MHLKLCLGLYKNILINVLLLLEGSLGVEIPYLR